MLHTVPMRSKPVFRQGLLDASLAIARLIEIAGGPTACGIKIGTSGQTITNMLEKKHVSSAILSHLMADLASKLGEPTITSRVLSGIDEWTRQGANGTRTRRARKGHEGDRTGSVTAIRTAEAVVPASKLGGANTHSQRRKAAKLSGIYLRRNTVSARVQAPFQRKRAVNE